MCSPIRSMLAPTPMARRGRERYARCARACVKQREPPAAAITQWSVLIRDHHPGFIDWPTYEANQARIDRQHASATASAGRRRERRHARCCKALAVCGHCGRELRTHYTRPHTPARLSLCRQGHRRMGAASIASTSAACRSTRPWRTPFLARVTPAGIEATLLAAEQLEDRSRCARSRNGGSAVERARYEAATRRAPLPRRRSRQSAGRPRPRSGMGEAAARTRHGRSRTRTPRAAAAADARAPSSAAVLLALGADLRQVWAAPTTTRRATARNCCARCSRRSSSRSSATSMPRASHPALAGRRTHRDRSPVADARRRGTCARMKTRSRWCAAWPCITPTP